MIPKREESLDLTSPNAVNYTIPDLISHLHLTCSSGDFAVVSNLLSAKEEKTKNYYSFLEEKHADLSLSHLQTEDELKSCKMENVELREEMMRAKDDIFELRVRIKGMERDKRAADALVKLYQSRFETLMVRVTRLEDDARVLMMSYQAQAEEEGRGTNALSSASLTHDQIGETQGQLPEEIACVSNKKKKDDPSTSNTDPGMPVKAVGNTQQVSETINTNSEMALPSDGRNSTRVVVEIIDSDDEQPMGVKASGSGLKRKGVLPFGVVDDEGSRSYSQIAGGEIKLPQELNIKQKRLRGSLGTSSKQNYGGLRLCEEKNRSALTSDQYFSQINSYNFEDSSSDDSDNDNWPTETDMMKALEKDAQLCMKAICALYREKAFKGSEAQNIQNHEKSTALRGASLAEFLINGDPRARLKRKVVELQKKDEKGLHDCKRISKLYSMKLFEIYKKDKDDFRRPFL